MLRVQRMKRGLALPMSRTTKRDCVGGGFGCWFPKVRYSSGASPLPVGRGTCAGSIFDELWPGWLGGLLTPDACTGNVTLQHA